MQKEFGHIRELNLQTGEVKLQEIAAVEGMTVYRYFYTLTSLNESAHVYGCVYLPTDLALGLLEGGSK